MAKYYIVYNDLHNQAVQFQNAQRELNDFECRLNSIADSMDDRDGSMAALKQQIKLCSRNIPAIVNRINSIYTSIADITDVYKKAEKNCYQDFGGAENSKNDANAPLGKSSGGTVESTLDVLGKLIKIKDKVSYDKDGELKDDWEIGLEYEKTKTASAYSGEIKGSAILGYGLTATGEASYGLLYGKMKGSLGAAFNFKDGKVYLDAKGELSGSLAHGETKLKAGLFTMNADADAVYAKVSGEAKLALFNDGKFDPSVDLEAKAEADALRGSFKTQFGTDDVNVNVGGDGALGTASAHGKIEIDKDGIEGDYGAEAAVAKGKIKGGLNLGIIKIETEVEGSAVSVGAHGNFKVSSHEIDIGAGVAALLGVGGQLRIHF